MSRGSHTTITLAHRVLEGGSAAAGTKDQKALIRCFAGALGLLEARGQCDAHIAALVARIREALKSMPPLANDTS
jgi:hypothetical protein